MIDKIKALACKFLYYITIKKVCLGVCDNCKL